MGNECQSPIRQAGDKTVSPADHRNHEEPVALVD